MTAKTIWDHIVFLLTKYSAPFFQGTGVTLLLSLITVAVGVVLGTVVILLKKTKFTPISWLSRLFYGLWVWILRLFGTAPKHARGYYANWLYQHGYRAFFENLENSTASMLRAIGKGLDWLLRSIAKLVKTIVNNLIIWIAHGYVEIVRGTPILLQLYFFYFLLPMIFPDVLFFQSKFNCVAIALVFNSAAYVSEIIRSGIQAVDRGQSEAARSLGLNGAQTMIRIVLPQAVKNILPALGNEFVMVIKETSLASVFFVGDLMTQYKSLSGALAMVIEPLLIIGVIYFVLTFTLSKLIGLLERRLKASD